MLTKDKAVRCLICTAGDLNLICICTRLYESVQIFLMFRDVVSKASEDCFVQFFGLFVGL